MQSIYYIMGVSGAGKTTFGKALAQRLQLPFFDGDDFHPEANIVKMAAGQALNDTDRQDWLLALQELAKTQADGAIIACSALKQTYRDLLEKEISIPVHWVYLKGDFDTILKRMQKREDHFMPTDLLQSQFDTLEEPTDAFVLNIEQSIPFNVDRLVGLLQTQKAEIGIIGMGVMGRNLARNIARNSFSVSLYNRRVEEEEEEVAFQLTQQFEELNTAAAFEHIAPFIASLERPRKVLMMVKAGKVVDQVIAKVSPHLDRGDILIDGGNSHFKDTERRIDSLKEMGIHFIGMGVSGGEEGALNGPALMPGGEEETYALISPILQKMAAKNSNGDHCCAYLGKGGSGHYIKMIHNGIEYAEMQLLAECYSILKSHFEYDNDQIAHVFSDWNQGELNSYLLEITATIFTKKEDGKYLIDQILDRASNKGTGAWTSINGIELGVPFNIIASALYARYTSSFKEKRVQLAQNYLSNSSPKTDLSIVQLKEAYAIARRLNHLQGFEHLAAASKQYDWQLDLAKIAQVWTGGCIIRSELMLDLSSILKQTTNLWEHPDWKTPFNASQKSLQQICISAFQQSIPIPTFTACFNYFNAMTQANSSANLIQAQRDFFGAHGYQRIDDRTPQLHHTNWTEL